MLHCHRLFTAPKQDTARVSVIVSEEMSRLKLHGTSENITIHSADDVKKVITAKNNLTYDVLMYQSIKTDQ